MLYSLLRNSIEQNGGKLMEQAIRVEKQREILVSPSGTGRLIYSISLPCLESPDRINAFYRKIANACIEYCKQELLTEYDVRSLNAGAEHWELIYRLSIKILPPEADAENILRVELSASLCDTSTHRIQSKHTEIHVWSLETDRLKK